MFNAAILQTNKKLKKQKQAARKHGKGDAQDEGDSPESRPWKTLTLEKIDCSTELSAEDAQKFSIHKVAAENLISHHCDELSDNQMSIEKMNDLLKEHGCVCIDTEPLGGAQGVYAPAFYRRWAPRMHMCRLHGWSDHHTCAEAEAIPANKKVEVKTQEYVDFTKKGKPSAPSAKKKPTKGKGKGKGVKK